MWLEILGSLCGGISTTVSITATAFLLGTVLGFPLALMRRSQSPVLHYPSAAFIELFRSVPPIVMVFLMFYAVGSGVVQLSAFAASVLGLGLIAAAFLAEVFRSGITSVSAGQWDASRALALPPFAVYSKVILPQAILVSIPPAATFAIGLLKDSAVASVAGARDITFLAAQESQATLQGLMIFLIAAGIYIVLSIPIAVFARWTDSALSKRVAL